MILAFWGFYRARVRYLLRKTQELEDTVSQRTTEVRIALQEAEAAKELLHEQATKDSLTGLWNRRAIFEIFDRELERCRADSSPLCVLMVDADRFKSINDTFGHLAGDKVIQVISQRLRHGLRQSDAIGRFGGEELLILLPRCPLEIGLQRAEKLRRAIEASPVVHDGQEISITCSFGIARSELARSSAEVIEEADAALYLAKKAGRNCVRSSQDTGTGGETLAIDRQPESTILSR